MYRCGRNSAWRLINLEILYDMRWEKFDLIYPKTDEQPDDYHFSCFLKSEDRAVYAL